MRQKPNRKKFFISYLNEDFKVAQTINEHLQKLGHETFFDKLSLRLGVDWRQEIREAIKNWCDYFLIIWSTNGDDRSESFVPVELNIARERREKKKVSNDLFILPVLIGTDAKFPPAFDIEGLQSKRLQDGFKDNDIEKLAISISDMGRQSVKGSHIGPVTDGKLGEVLNRIKSDYQDVIDRSRLAAPARSANFIEFDDNRAIYARTDHIAKGVKLTISQNTEAVKASIEHLMEWMINETVVRVIGAGRAKLAASIPANRLAHGGARVYIQDDIVPWPHDIKSGGIIAASASGRTPSVLGVLREIFRKKGPGNFSKNPFKVIGIASNDANEFKGLCDEFIGIRLSNKQNPLRALSDIEESVIMLVFDALVAAAGWQAGFDNTRWRLGHENLGSTGNYDAITSPSLPPHAPHQLCLPTEK